MKTNNKKVTAVILCAALCAGLSGCKSTASSGDDVGSVAENTETGENIGSEGAKDETGTVGESEVTTEEMPSETEEEILWIETGKPVVFNYAAGFYKESIELALRADDEDGIIHYTTDGSRPDTDSEVYTEPIFLKSDNSNFPNAYCIRAVVEYKDGTLSDVVANTFFVNRKIEDRFTTLVFSISGDPADLTEGPDGIFYGDNYSDRGRESEREVYVEAFSPDGDQILGQFAGVRIYGGVSRESSIKSMKLFARKSYDPEHGSFKISLFGSEDINGDLIKKYDKLVLRNTGNDFQFAYIRDEFAQTLAKEAGFSDYEAVLPAVGYLNGNYYGFYWLHESYCDDYFKNKYGDGPGEFVVVEGNEQYKWVSGDDDKTYADEYQKLYDSIKDLDMTIDENYKLVTDSIDVENYLDYYAFNIFICNKDWPQNNYKCYRYEFAEGESAGSGVFDGRWRYLLHDIDYTFGLYEQRETQASYDMLAQILKSGSERYSPLFSQLMKREDCKMYFIEKMLEFMNGPLSSESILSTLEDMQNLRDTELSYYYEHLEDLRNNGDESIWSWKGHLEGYVQLIKDFANERQDYMAKFLTKNLGVAIIQDDDGIYMIDTE